MSAEYFKSEVKITSGHSKTHFSAVDCKRGRNKVGLNLAECGPPLRGGKCREGVGALCAATGRVRDGEVRIIYRIEADGSWGLG